MSQKLYIGLNEVEFNDKFNVKMQVSDARDPNIGSSTKSYTLKIPLTKLNKRILKDPFDIRTTEQLDDTARLLTNDIEIIRGKLRLLSSNKAYASGIINANQWIDLIKDTSLRDLSWVSGDAHILNGDNVEDSWTAAAGAFYRYPMINYGRLYSGEMSSIAKVLPNDFVATWNVQDIVTKIFADAGYLLDTNGFFHSTFGQKLYINSQEEVAESGFISGKNLDVQVNDNADNQDQITHPGGITASMAVDNDPMVLTNEIEDEGFDFATNVYTVPTTGTYRFQSSVNIYCSYNKEVGFSAVTNTLASNIQVNSVPVVTVGASGSTSFDAGNEVYTMDTGYIHLEAGDLIKMNISLYAQAYNNTERVVTLAVVAGNESFLKLVWDDNCRFAGIGKSITPVAYLPDIDSVSFLKGLKEVANLRFWADEFNKTIHILDADSFVGDTIKDWSDRQDYSKEIEAEIIASNFHKSQVLQYSPDESDRAYTEYISSNDIPFTKEITLTNSYAKEGEKINSNSVFAPTIADDFYNIANTSANIPRIWGSGTRYLFYPFPANRPTSWKPRLLQWDGLTALTTGGYRYYDNWDDTSYTTYSTFAKMSTPDMSDMFDSYWIKHWRYVDNSRLLGVTVYVNQNELAQFMTVIANRDEEGFGVTYKLNINDTDMLFILNNLVTDGIKAKCEFTQKM